MWRILDCGFWRWWGGGVGCGLFAYLPVELALLERDVDLRDAVHVAVESGARPATVGPVAGIQTVVQDALLPVPVGAVWRHEKHVTSKFWNCTGVLL